MLTLTENAQNIVNEITKQPGFPESAGLRITSENAADQGTPEPTFAVSAAEQAEPGDQVVKQEGATIFLDETSALMLDDKVLDAAVDQQGQVEFALGIQS